MSRKNLKKEKNKEWFFFINLTIIRLNNKTLPNAFKCFWQSIQTAQFIPAFVSQPAACRIWVFVLKTNTTSQEEHEILMKQFVFWADKAQLHQQMLQFCVIHQELDTDSKHDQIIFIKLMKLNKCYKTVEHSESYF